MYDPMFEETEPHTVEEERSAQLRSQNALRAQAANGIQQGAYTIAGPPPGPHGVTPAA